MTRRATRVSVPGKLILMGEHAAVYGRPAVVASIGLRMRVVLRPSHEPGVAIELPDLGVDCHLSWSEIDALTRTARERWEAFAAAPSPARFASLRPDGPEELVALALGEAARSLAPGGPMESGVAGAWSVRLESELPVGSGFGSSASAAVGLVVAYLASRGAAHGWKAVDGVALEVERRQHGFPSGVDSATVFHGGVLHCRRVGDALAVEPLAAAPDLLRALHVYDTGPPAESTGTVVADVRARRDRDPETFESRLERMGAATERFRAALEVGGRDPRVLIEPMRAYQRCLEELGVVPRPVRQRVAAIESAGGAAKISGAGSLTGAGAGSLLVVYGGDDAPDALADLEELGAPLGAEGARLESVA